MPARTHETLPLTLSEQLDAMLLGWLEFHADRERSGRPGLRAHALITVAERLPEIEARISPRSLRGPTVVYL